MLSFMAEHELCVISTVSSTHAPESAIVGFSHDEDLNLYIGTSNKSRKYANLTQNPRAAIVIGNWKAEIQYEGNSEIIVDTEYMKLVEQKHINKLPGTAEYRKNQNQVYVKISPTWIRFLQHGDNGSVQEFTEFKS